MRTSTGLGFGIAALAAAGVLAVYLFGSGREDWMSRAAQQEAVRCLTSGPCVQIDAHGWVVRQARAPLTTDSGCAARKNWRAVPGGKPGGPLLLICRDGASYLFHLGALSGRDAGSAQWLRCAEESCAREMALFVKY